MSHPRAIHIEIPPGAEPGDFLTFQVDGVEMEIPIPQGSLAGEILEIRMDSDSPPISSSMKNHKTVALYEDSQDEVQDGHHQKLSSDDVTVLSLDPSIEEKVIIHHKVPLNYFQNKEEERKEGTYPSDGTYDLTWHAGLRLANFVSSPSFHERMGYPSISLELGSGTGLVGLSYAISCHKSFQRHHDVPMDRNDTNFSPNKGLKHDDSSFQKQKVILTDLQPALSLIQYNIDCIVRQFGIHMQKNIDIEAVELSWGDSLSFSLSRRSVDLILASDILYNAKMETYLALRKTIESMNMNGNAKLVISVRWRKPEEERQFFQIMNDVGYEFHLLHGMKDTCFLGWRDFGNPTCHASNSFFAKTKIRVDGVFKALNEVSEEDTDVMNDEEYKTFEDMFVQIYIGQKDTKHNCKIE